MEIILESANGAFVGRLNLTGVVIVPHVIIWGDKAYVKRMFGNWVETPTYTVHTNEIITS